MQDDQYTDIVQEPDLPKHKNPYFHKKSTSVDVRKLFRLFLYFLITIFILYISSIFIFLRNANYNIKTVVYTGNTRLSNQVLTDAVNEHLSGHTLFFASKKNMYLLDRKSLSEFLTNRFGLAELKIDTIKKDSMLHIQLTERPLQYTVTIGDSTYYLASDGSILEKLLEDQTQIENLFHTTIPETSIQNNESSGLQFVPEDIMSSIHEIEQQVLTIDEGLIIVRVVFESGSMQDIKLLTSDNWYIYIDRSQNIQQQIESARVVYTQKIKNTDSQNTLQYIDVRVLGRAYFK